MLALLDSLLVAGFDPEDQGRRALAWERDVAYTPDGDGRFDEGIATSRALHGLARGVAAIDAGPADERSSSNGSLMRILPLALVERDLDPGELIRHAHLASRVTHGHPRCQVACAVYSLMVVELLRGSSPGDALASALLAAREQHVADPSLAPHRAALDELEAWDARSGRGFVPDAFWSAWDAFAGAASYEETIRRAIAYGTDTDTTAAIAGGLAGAYWGWDGIPRDWRRGMRGRAIVTPLVDALVEGTGARTSTSKPLRVDRLDLGGVASLDGAGGRVGITFLPGKKRDGWTGPHWRDPDVDLARCRELGVDALFLLVEDAELDWCLVPELPEVMAEVGPELVRYPVRDPRIPTDAVAFRAALQELLGRAQRGQFIAIACRGGIDRSGMAAGCLLREAGLEADDAIDRVHAARTGSLTLGEQLDYVRAWPPRVDP
jgi:ADP-ribosylglycohydrolase